MNESRCTQNSETCEGGDPTCSVIFHKEATALSWLNEILYLSLILSFVGRQDSDGSNLEWPTAWCVKGRRVQPVEAECVTVYVSREMLVTLKSQTPAARRWDGGMGAGLDDGASRLINGKTMPSIQLSESGIAKGFADDEVLMRCSATDPHFLPLIHWSINNQNDT